jgi:hypothetical protein
MFPGRTHAVQSDVARTKNRIAAVSVACDALMRDQVVSRAAFAPATNYHPLLEPRPIYPPGFEGPPC